MSLHPISVLCAVLALGASMIHQAAALPEQHTNSSVNAAIDAGTFSNPSVNIRPKFRYWLPDASVDPALIAEDIKAIGGMGAGGIEFLNYYLYGGDVGAPVTNWSEFGFATPAYNTVLKAALQATKDNNLIMDFEMGPQSGQGVPADPTNPGLSYELISFNATVSPGSTFSGLVPGWGAGNLVSVTTAAILKSTPETIAGSGSTAGQTFTFTLFTVANASLTDVTPQVQPNGSLTVSFPETASFGPVIDYIIYASYYHLTDTRACIPGPNPQNIIQNGSFAVDHFSPAGAKVTTDFLEQFVLVNGVKELMQEVGNYIWEDSIEVSAVVEWTPLLAQTFKSMHGYDIGIFTMLLAQGNENFVANHPSLVGFNTDAPDQGEGIVADYRDTLTALYGTYLDHFVQWTHEFLNLQFSAQIGYNLPVDMLENINRVDAPETENLAFFDNIDAYRQYVGPANLAGKRIISCELGAINGETYQQTLPSILTLSKHAYVAGVNQLVLHGATFSHEYPETTWPGYTQFSYVFSEGHSRHQPAWERGYREFVDNLARHQFVLQSGTPKVDVVFWDKQSAQDDNLPTLYTFSDLETAGYTYQYLSPANFDLPQAVVTDGVLAADGPAYKVLVLPESTLLTVDGITKLAEFANQGLPIIIAGNPTVFATRSTDEVAAAQATLAALPSHPNVHKIAAGPVGPTIASIGIEPSTQISSTSIWLTNLRQTPDGTNFLFVYSNTTSTGAISFASTQKPFVFDTNTGSITPVLAYTVTADRTTIPLSLAADQTIIIAFSNADLAPTPSIHVTSSPSCILGFSFSTSSGITAQVPDSCTGTLTTSDNTTHDISTAPVPASINISTWTLVAESWTPLANFSALTPVATRTNTTHQLSALVPWTQIPGLETSSGVGYYNSSFTWDASSSSQSGARINFGPVTHTLRVRINGHPLPPLDVTRAEADISEFLVQGTNTIQAEIATTLFNVLAPIWTDLRTSGVAPEIPPVALPSSLEQGLVGTVTVVPWAGLVVG